MIKQAECLPNKVFFNPISCADRLSDGFAQFDAPLETVG
jgi:hypothetical protein